MLDELRRMLEDEPDIRYALLFGSGARGALRTDSDLDVAIELRPGAARGSQALGRLVARLETATRRSIDLVLIDEAPSPLAYRIFRDGRVVLERDHAALVARKARAILDYLDFKPVETRCAAGVLHAAATRG
jgi:predicted nucleotidyltransferase